MLRLLVLVLLLANAGYYAWAHGLLAVMGAAPTQQSEPQRIAQQIQPEVVRVLTPDEVRRLDLASAGASRPVECLQTGLLADTQVPALRQVLDTWPQGSWRLDASVEPAHWIVYMGRYESEDHVARKKAELRQLGVSFEPLGNPAFAPGLSLGSYASQQAATAQLQSLAQKGVRTARVLQERPETRGQLLRLAAVDDDLRPRLGDLKTALAGKPLQPCR